MKQTLQLRQGQRLQLNPQLTFSLKLLQLSRTDLDLEIRAELETNPFLEEVQLSDGSSSEISSDTEAHQTTLGTDESIQVPDFDTPQWEEHLGASRADQSADYLAEPDQPMWADPMQGLRTRLLNELALHRLNPDDALIAHTLIGCLDERGYLTVDHDELREILERSLAPTDQEIDSVLHLIQSLALPGLGARDLRECLMLQLNAMAEETPGVGDARVIVASHLELLGNHQYDALAKILGINRETLGIAIQLIQTLDPKPGERLSEQLNETAPPDLIVKRAGDQWVVRLTREYGRLLRVNESYREYQNSKDRETREYIRDHLRNAHSFMKGLEQRDQTVLRVAEAILEVQRGFMDSGDSALAPLTLKDIGEKLEIHESTVSRAVDQKYILTPHGVITLKHFFSASLGNASGARVSARAAQARIREVIESESASKPVSDGRVAQVLCAEGIPIARRTVAKYREQMNIPPAAQRRGVV